MANTSSNKNLTPPFVMKFPEYSFTMGVAQNLQSPVADRLSRALSTTVIIRVPETWKKR